MTLIVINNIFVQKKRGITIVTFILNIIINLMERSCIFCARDSSGILYEIKDTWSRPLKTFFMFFQKYRQHH
jgi:hypothetical protein